MPMRINTQRVSQVAPHRSFDYSEDLYHCVKHLFQISLLLHTMSAQDNQIGVFNNTQATISVRITSDNELSKGTTEFQDIKPGKYDTWNRSHRQVAFVQRNSDEMGGTAEVVVLKPAQVHYVNDE
ncbi:hypothetical protein EV702DRAFT_1199291 [Suillus placidus]|uniref:Uncharacterized protein n=1 Tax=Suillus placidus TaxID=48579 RepID=A0A9P7D1G8_9AGAM|nr:hypothetical protein EV702DRAFT_1199291 [Suillus placidus]